MEITVAGKQCRASNQSAFNKLSDFLSGVSIADGTSEKEVRKILLPFVETKLSATEWILYDGNSIWDVKRLVKQFKTLIKYYDYQHFTNYLYEFFHLQCGSIAHYNKSGWFATYPDLHSLKEFFKSNEYGTPVDRHVVAWHYDAHRATEAMSALLFGPGTTPKYPRY